MKNQSFDIPLHDIKPLLDVDDYTFYYFIGGSLVVIILILGVFYLAYKFLKNRNRYSIRKDYLDKIASLDLNDTKKTAYALTLYGDIFKEDSPRHTQMYKNITQRLEPYKYKKVVDKFDDETLGYIELYRGMLDV